MTYGRWQVIGRRKYRGHPTGTVFDADLQDGPASRAIARRDIVLLEHIEPGLPPEYTFPEGWLTAAQANHRGAERRLIR